jgi:hypothetical protein
VEGPHRQPLSTITRATLEGLCTDLGRAADALDVESPLLVVMLLGGTGVGKSTLFNALAGGTLAAASIQRPTTKDPVVYYHESVRPDRLDPLLRSCRLVPHDRPSLAQKVIVDTPDLDSTNLANRETLFRVLPVADVVLYVGSQEKYHDALIWEQFLKQRQRRAFAFVLNKWDRCLHAGAAGMRPDEDLLKDLKSKGFHSPLLFRTCAQLWVNRTTGQKTEEPPEGEQFQQLVDWLEGGISRLEIEAIKSRGVSQMLAHLESSVSAAAPLDLTEAALKVKEAWGKPLEEEASATAGVLLNALEPFQKEIEHHFALEGRKRFSGMMAGYLSVVTYLQYLGSALPSRLSLIGGAKNSEPVSAWDIGMFTRACSDAAASKQLDARGKALANQLLVTGDANGMPVTLLTGPVEGMSRMDWRAKWERMLLEVLEQVERQWTQPTGGRAVLQTLLVLLADWLPAVVLVAGLGLFLWQYFNLPGAEGHVITWVDVFLPFIATLVVLLLMHLIITIFLPLRWSAIRQEFHKLLEARILQEMREAYLEVPVDVAAKLLEERKKAEALNAEVREVAEWLRQREQSATITSLYGKDESNG